MKRKRRFTTQAVIGNMLLVLSCLFMAAVAFAADRTVYYHTDFLGSVVAATDESGALLWRESYRPFGERIDREVSTKENTPFYTGKPHDDDTGLSYFGARDYDPIVGRFLGIDPAGVDPANLHSFNRYAYVNNNPYRYVDPDGRAPLSLEIFRKGSDMDQAMFNSAPFRAGLDTAGTVVTGAGMAMDAGSDIVNPVKLGIKRALKEAAKRGPSIGGGGTLDKLSPGEIQRIQNAANRSGQDIGVVGSRVNPNKTVRPDSDYDYVIDANHKTRNNLSRSLPGGKSVRGGMENNQDIYKGTVDTNRPHVIFHPE